MHKLTLTITLSILTSLSFAQNTHLDYKYALKVYNLTSFEENTESVIYNGVQSIETSLQILHPTVAFQWKSAKNNFHEVELTSLKFGKFETQTELVDEISGNNQLVDGNNVTSVDVSMRYEFMLNFNKARDAKLVPSIGFGANPYFRRTSSTPKTATFYPSSETSAGIRGFVTPRLTYYMNSKLFLDVNLPFCVVDSYVQHSNRIDPVLPIEEQNATSVNFQGFPKRFSARIGLGLKF